MKESFIYRKTITGKNIIKFAAPVGGLLLTASCSNLVNALTTQPEQIRTQQAQISDLQSTLESMSNKQPTTTPEAPKDAAPTQEPKHTNEVVNKTSQETEDMDLPEFAISGVPESVKSSDIIHWTGNETEEGQKTKGDVIHKNTIGLNTEGFLAEPGVRTFSDREDIGSGDDGKSVWLTSEHRQKLVTDPSAWPLNEDGFAMITTAQAQVEFNGIIAQFGRIENNGWLILVRGLPRHNEQNTDANIPMKISNFDEGFTDATMLPPGQYVSQEYLEQNSDAIHGTYGKKQEPSGLGVDGARYATVAMIDAKTGAYTVVQHDSQTGQWTLIATNIK
jgi:hypothetical protein